MRWLLASMVFLLLTGCPRAAAEPLVSDVRPSFDDQADGELVVIGRRPNRELPLPYASVIEQEGTGRLSAWRDTLGGREAVEYRIPLWESGNARVEFWRRDEEESRPGDTSPRTESRGRLRLIFTFPGEAPEP